MLFYVFFLNTRGRLTLYLQVVTSQFRLRTNRHWQRSEWILMRFSFSKCSIRESIWNSTICLFIMYSLPVCQLISTILFVTGGDIRLQQQQPKQSPSGDKCFSLTEINIQQHRGYNNIFHTMMYFYVNMYLESLFCYRILTVNFYD